MPGRAHIGQATRLVLQDWVILSGIFDDYSQRNDTLRISSTDKGAKCWEIELTNSAMCIHLLVFEELLIYTFLYKLPPTLASISIACSSPTTVNSFLGVNSFSSPVLPVSLIRTNTSLMAL
jgi:hypothetical protein